MAARFEASINRELLRWGRARIRMPLEVAARKIGVDATTLASWELGESRPSFSKLRAVAQAYHKPLSFFYLKEPPEEIDIPADFRRITGGIGGDDSDVMVTIFESLRRRSILIDIYKDSGWPLPSFDLQITAENTTAATAAQLRGYLGVKFDEQFRSQSSYESLNLWRRVIEGRGVLVFQTGVSVDEMRGLSIHQNTFPVVVINAKDAPSARVFSLLHELTHLALRQGGICTFSEFGDDHVAEAYCDAVAAQVLVPTEELQQQIANLTDESSQGWTDFAFAALAKKFGVSEHVIVRRFFELGLIDDRDYWERVRVLSLRRYNPNSSGGTHYRNRVAQMGRPYIRTVLAAYEAGSLSPRDAALYLGTNVDGFDKLREAAQ